jgi:3-deoxy-D-manno-octulosonate 8-phosphate phosphatase (KDO 8-P phosphatase)
MRAKFHAKLKKIKFFVLDVDGVLTDGGIIIGSDGTEYKKFDVKDGSGIALARHVGIKFAILSGRFSKVIELRAAELKIDAVYQNILVKMEAYDDLKNKFCLKDEEICFVGDEIIDIPVMEKCGFASAPADAVAETRKTADYVCKSKGGRGCVRETVEMVLKAQGLWQKAIARYLRYEKPVF